MKNIPGVRLVIIVVTLVGLTDAKLSATAPPYEFANFHLVNADQPFSFSNDGGTSATMQASASVVFNFTTQSGLSTTDHLATVTIAPVITTTPASTSSFLLIQPVGGFTLTVTEDGSGLNLLTLNVGNSAGFPSVSIVGAQSNAAIASTADGNQPISFASSFGTFATNGFSSGNSFHLGLATIAPQLSIGPGGFLNSFVSNIDGQFTGNFVAAVPEPSTMSILLGSCGLLLAGLVVSRTVRSSR